MNTLRSILIKAMMELPEGELRKMFITVSAMRRGLTDADKLDPMTEYIIDRLQGMDYQNREMVCGLVLGLSGEGVA